MSEATEDTERIFDRETLLDLAGTFIPLGIILLLTFYMLLRDPFGPDWYSTLAMVALHAVPFFFLAVVTYYAGKVITEAERTGRSRTAEAAASAATSDESPPGSDRDGS